MKFTLAEKINMTQIFGADGIVIPVTVLKAKGVTVTATRTLEKDGYEAIAVKQEGGKKVKEFRTPAGDLQLGAHIAADVFQVGDVVAVSGISKGKGFQGVVKRHGFVGGWGQHGQKHSHREPGSIGATWPQRVLKGKRMAGRMGSNRITLPSVTIVSIDTDSGIMMVKGAVPGKRGTVVEIRG